MGDTGKHTSLLIYSLPSIIKLVIIVAGTLVFNGRLLIETVKSFMKQAPVKGQYDGVSYNMAPLLTKWHHIPFPP